MRDKSRSPKTSHKAPTLSDASGREISAEAKGSEVERRGPV